METFNKFGKLTLGKLTVRKRAFGKKPWTLIHFHHGKSVPGLSGKNCLLNVEVYDAAVMSC